MATLLRRARGHVSARPWRSIPRPALLTGAALLAGTAMIAAVALGGPANAGNAKGNLPARIADFPGEGDAPSLPGSPAQASFTGIILPDLLIVMPSGLTAADRSGLRKIKGVRKMISFDGAQIAINGRPASVVGVSPGQFRSWVPLSTATDQKLWTALAAGRFVASTQATHLLALSAGGSYQLTGAAPAVVSFAGPAQLGIAGIDLLVNQSLSNQLGLVRQVAALISAPGPSMPELTAQVRKVLGAGARVVDLRGQRLPAHVTQPAQITNYLQLFQAAAARYCPAMSWTILAAIGQIESADGQNMGPSTAGALGPMQFLPSTWARWGIDGFGPAGPPDIMNPMDAVPSAARMLCADGASAGTQAGLRQAIFAYNHAGWYVNEVLALAGQYSAEYR